MPRPCRERSLMLELGRRGELPEGSLTQGWGKGGAAASCQAGPQGGESTMWGEEPKRGWLGGPFPGHQQEVQGLCPFPLGILDRNATCNWLCNLPDSVSPLVKRG